MKKVNMNKSFITFIILSGIILSVVHGQPQTSVQVQNFYITPPNPIFLSDFVTPVTDKLNLTLLFTDSDEPSRDVILRIRIESNDIRILTKSDYRPSQPITLIPHTPYKVSYNELEPYFSFSNISVEGISPNEFEKSGGILPEGNYMMYVRVVDEISGVDLCQERSTMFSVRLFEPPVIVEPVSKSIIEVKNIQDVKFQWQMPQTNPAYFQSSPIVYDFYLYELIDPTIDPDLALVNNSVLEVYVEEGIMFNTFVYDISKPLLENGKKYIYKVKARDTQGRAVFKNNGESETGWFSYGYPTGGNISDLVPEDGHSFTSRENTIFKWQAPDNILTGQQYYNTLTIVELDEGQLPEDGIEYNEPFYFYKTKSEYNTFAKDHFVLTKFTPLKKYAWQVKAFSEETEIAKSEILEFMGPPLMEKFTAGQHTVDVLTTTTTDVEHLSGTGRAKISADEKVDVVFNDIKLEKVGTKWILRSGVVTGDLDIAPIRLTPEYEQNEEAYFHPDKMRITTEAKELYGHIEWNIPMAVKTENEKTLPVIKSKWGWINYDTYYLSGSLSVDDNYRTLELLDPVNFIIALSERSDILMRDYNHFLLRFAGDVHIPQTVKSSDGKNIALKFVADQLFYITGECPDLNIRLVKNTEIIMSPKTFIIDFDDTKSPDKYKNNPEWKGVLFDNYDITYYDNFDDKKQLVLYWDNKHHITYSDDDSLYSCVTSTGLQLVHYYRFNSINENSFFKTFPSRLNRIYIRLEDSYVQSGYAKGNMILPVYNDTTKLFYTSSILNDGFANGDLDKSLDGQKFVFNPDDEEKKLNITIDRAVFADNERLDMTLSIEWPNVNASIEKISTFKAWGDYSIGFDKKNGVIPLSQQVTGELKGREIVIDYIGAGKNPGLYSIGFATKINLGSGVTGPEGPPKSNIFSICKKEILGDVNPNPRNVDLNLDAYKRQETSDDIIPPGATTNTVQDIQETPTIDPVEARRLLQQNMSVATERILGSIDTNAVLLDTGMVKQYVNIPVEDNTGSQVYESRTKSQKEVNTDSLYQAIFDTQPGSSTVSEPSDNETEDSFLDPLDPEAPFSREKLVALIDKITIIAPDEYAEKITEVKEFILDLEDEYQVDLYEDLKNWDSLIAVILKQEYDKVLDKALKPIQDVADSANKYVTASVKSVTDIINNGIGYTVDTVVNTINAGLFDLFKEQEARNLIKSASATTRDVIVKDLTGRVNGFTDEYIISPVTDGIITKITSIVHDSLKAQFQGLGYELIEENVDADITDKIHIDRIINSLGDEVFASLFNIDSITNRITEMKDAFLKEYFDPKDIVDDILTQLAIEGMSFLANEVQSQTNKLNESITKEINTLRDGISNGVATVVNGVIDGITSGVKDAVDNETINGFIDDVGGIFSASVTNAVTNNINEFTFTYITEPITVNVIGKISLIIQDSIRQQVKRMAYAIKNDNGNTNFKDNINIASIYESVESAILDDIFNPDSVKYRLELMRDGFMEAFLDPDKLFDDILNEALALAASSLTDMAGDAIADAVAGDALGTGVSDALADMAINSIPLDFADFTNKLATEGSVIEDGFDPIALDYTSQAVDIIGDVFYIKHEVYGEVYTGNVDVLVKVPRRFKASALYMNGNTEEVPDYWFVGFNGVTQKSDSTTGAKGGYIPLGIVNILRINGYLYHNMSFTEDYPLPDASIDVGGDLGLTLIDARTMGADLLLNMDAKVAIESEGYLKLKMDGAITVGNNGATPLAQGTLELDFDSEEEHYYGKGWMQVDNEALCAEGSLIVDLEKKHWRVALGTHDERISVTPMCYGWGAKGWLDVNDTLVDLGLGVSFSAKAESPSFKIFWTKYWGYAHFMLGAGIMAKVQYKPMVRLNEAGLWAEAEAAVGIGKQKKGGSKHYYDIASAYLYGEAIMRFNPPPEKVYGYLEGRFSVLGLFKKNFEYDFDKTL